MSDPALIPVATRDGVTLSKRERSYRLEFGPYALEVDPVDGGRIVALSLDSENVIATPDRSPEAYGSSFWPSPQRDWKWPPPVEFDKAEWNVQTEGTSLVLESSTSIALGLSATQRIGADRRREAFLIEFALTNRSDVTRRVAAWQNTRCPPGGLTFFPSASPTLPESAFRVEPAQGVLWYRHDPSAPAHGKLFFDGGEGWIAHAVGDLLFLKVFPEVARDDQAPGESDVELYVDPARRFVEVEQQGPYVALAPGASSTWPVLWLVRRVPPHVLVEARSAALLQFARRLVGVTCC
jgi:hypothetical protein